MTMHRYNSIDELNKALVEFEESTELIVKSIKTEMVNNEPIFFVLTDKKYRSHTGHYNPPKIGFGKRVF